MPCKEDLIGNVYGRLTVIAEAERLPGKRACWVCQCECGNTVTVVGDNLRRGHTKSCGCFKSPDLTGRVFGRLTVIGKSDKRSPRGNRTVPMWECRCECGEITYRTADTLNMRGDTSMCSDCAAKYTAEAARECAGFVDGTMLSKIIDPKPSSNNTSGYCGVYYDKNIKKYRAQLKFKGKVMKFGCFSKIEDAVAARKKAEEEYFETFIEEYKRRTAVSAAQSESDDAEAVAESIAT